MYPIDISYLCIITYNKIVKNFSILKTKTQVTFVDETISTLYIRKPNLSFTIYFT